MRNGVLNFGNEKRNGVLNLKEEKDNWKGSLES
jgi:hypothetical protein